MNRHLCIWLPNLPDHNGSANKPASNAALELVARRIHQQVCPLIAIETLDKKPWAGQTKHRPESLFCEIAGVTHLFDGEVGMIRAVEQLLASQQISGQIAIADSVGAAWAVAHYGNCTAGITTPSHLSLRERSGSQARERVAEQTTNELPKPSPAATASDPPASGRVKSTIASNANSLRKSTHVFAERKSTYIIPSGATRQAIEPLPVEALRITEETAQTLSRLGVHFIRQLLQLPRSGLAPRLGKPLVQRIEQALGEVEEALAAYHPPVEHIAVHRLEHQTSDQNILADRIDRLIKKVRAGMATCQRGALRVTCRLDLTDHPPLTLEVGLFAPTIDTDHLCGLLSNRLESIKLPSTVDRITLSVPLTGPLRSTQTNLFTESASETNTSFSKSTTKKISRLVDSLSGRLGCGSVVGVRLKDNPLPEKAFSISPLAGTNSSGIHLMGNNQSSVRCDSSCQSSSHFSTFPSADQAMRRPLCLLSKPVLLAVANDNGVFGFEVCSTDIPKRVRVGGTVHSIVRCWGSERIETSWWNGPSIRRDYYRIETDQGRWWWIFRDLASKTDGYRWMLHGRFN